MEVICLGEKFIKISVMGNTVNVCSSVFSGSAGFKYLQHSHLAVL
jgi:hypothetical protein